ncbi:unnamed protein product [Zymoseptoria tritici ST99CH_1A5]|uniref:DNA-binding protein RAP1 n=2 Tax=Zymoseptoria tritici TaxID=1047171 RepID=A0A1X7RSA5_ZYMT9|nr:unnamed protein product [Zymoseptoria tritici ST99CH_3D7]SMY23533.1 unnamed protein product [Zymoseptoria tritici ST99CH_1A5]
MADAPVLVTNGAGGSPAVGRLLEGKSFFLVQRLPARSHLIADIESNAGRIVKLETNADYVIADHARKDAPAGSLSYTFVEQAIRKGALPDPLEHPAGPQVGTAREAGSVIPGKSFRTPFSAADDKILWRWVETAKANGEASKGNDVYKRLEAVNPRHTWQSWRDRYVKKLLGKPPAGVMVAANAPPSPPTAPDNDQISNGRSARETTPRPSPKRRKVTASPEKQVAGRSGPVFEQADFDTVMAEAEHLETVPHKFYKTAWKHFAQEDEFRHHTAEEWQEFYETEVRPVYIRERLKMNFGNVLSELEQDAPRNDEDNDQESERSDRNEAAEEIEQQGDISGDGQASDAMTSPPGQPTGQSGMKRKRSPVHPRRGSNASRAASQKSFSAKMVMKDRSRGAPASTQSRVARTVDADLREAFDNVPGLRSLQASVRAHMLDVDDHEAPSSSQLITSDANREAAAQLQAEADRATAHARETPSKSIGGTVNEDGEDSFIEEDGDFDDEASQRRGDALTEANLASQEAQHKQKLVRGVDLPEDDPMVDQSDFISYIQAAMGKEAIASLTSPFDKAKTRDAAVRQGPTDTPLRLQTADPLQGFPPVPLSEERDDDESSNDSLPWASSQRQADRHEDSSTRQLQSQIEQSSGQDPIMHKTTNGAILGPDNEASIPSVSVRGWPSMDAALLDSQDDEKQPSKGVSASALLHEYTFADGERSDDDMAEDEEDGDQTLQQTYPDNEDEIDLRIPEPDGGFTFTSSVEGEQDGPPARSTEHHDRDERYLNPEVISLSSAVLSSPYQSSSATKPLQQGHETPQRRGHALETQEIVDFGSQELDLEIPSPSASDIFDDEEYAKVPAEGMKATSSRPLDTQDILDAQTQYADLNVALPLSDDDDDLDDDSSEDSQIPAKPATKHKVRPGRTVESQALTGDPEQIADKLDEWIATQEVRGYNNEASMRAMLCTSMRPDLAELVLLGEKGGTGLPHDVSGIWSEREDRAVEGGDAAAIRRLEAKHGWDECKARLKFLADWREV